MISGREKENKFSVYVKVVYLSIVTDIFQEKLCLLRGTAKYTS
jgi:hypothetical protein